MSQDLIALVDAYAQAYHADKLQHQYGCSTERKAVVAAIQKVHAENIRLMDAEKKASLRHFISAAMVFSSTWPKEPVTAQQKAHGDLIHSRALNAFDEWFSLQDAQRRSQPLAQGDVA